MRISSTLFFRTGLDTINTQQADLHHLYQQTGSGKRMVTPSDDPLAAAQAINLGQSQALNKRYAENRQVIKQNLNAEYEVLKSVVTTLQDVKTHLISAGNGMLSDADRRSLADALTSAKAQILTLANATDGNGQYLFSGHQQVDGKPFDDQGCWNNALSGQRMIQVDQTRQLAGSDLGVDVFARNGSSMFESFDDVIKTLNTDTKGDPASAAAVSSAIATAIQRFDAHYDNVLTVQSSVSARMAEVIAIDDNGAARHLGYSQRLSQLEDLNYYEASTQLQLRTAALEAAALAFRKIQSASFLNMRNG